MEADMTDQYWFHCFPAQALLHQHCIFLRTSSSREQIDESSLLAQFDISLPFVRKAASSVRAWIWSCCDFCRNNSSLNTCDLGKNKGSVAFEWQLQSIKFATEEYPCLQQGTAALNMQFVRSLSMKLFLSCAFDATELCLWWSSWNQFVSYIFILLWSRDITTLVLLCKF